MSDRVVGNTLDGVIVSTEQHEVHGDDCRRGLNTKGKTKVTLTCTLKCLPVWTSR